MEEACISFEEDFSRRFRSSPSIEALLVIE